LQPECFERAPKESGAREEGTVAKEDRGFASMDRGKQREIASKGGKAAHQKGTAHEWTSDEAREAGRKGGMASHRRKQQQGESAAPVENVDPNATPPSKNDSSDQEIEW
jgi:general stress protein YciG